MTSNSLAIREKSEVKFGRELRKEFLFDEKFLNLNHGKIMIAFARICIFIPDQ